MKINISLLLFTLTISFSTSCICLNSNASSKFINKEYPDVIIDPVQISCCEIFPDSSIRILKTNSNYVGRIIMTASIDTMNLEFDNYKIVFAKLQSKINPNDTIEIRMDLKSGNFDFVEGMKPELIKHLNYIKLKRIKVQGCVWPTYSFPIKIE